MLQSLLKERYPERTFTGRERVSLVPRWISNYITLVVIIYFGGGILLDFLGFDGWDVPFIGGKSADEVAAAASYSTPTPVLKTASGDFQASSDPRELAEQFLQATQEAVELPPAQPTLTPYPTLVPLQALPTLTPYPTQRPIVGDLIAVGYSYYWPPFGPPNCMMDNWHDNYCEDVTASGLRWSDYIGQGVAVPVQWVQDGSVPLGSTLRVHSPNEMIGDYLVLDVCGGCITPEGHVYVDFLDNRARLNWTVPLLVEVIR